MTLITIFWSVMSLIPGAGFLVAGKSLWEVRKQPGSLMPLIFCIANGFYDIAFGIMLLLYSIREPGQSSIDLILIWLMLFLPARITSVGLALMLSGQIDENWIRKILRLEIKSPDSP